MNTVLIHHEGKKKHKKTILDSFQNFVFLSARPDLLSKKLTNRCELCGEILFLSYMRSAD